MCYKIYNYNSSILPKYLPDVDSSLFELIKFFLVSWPITGLSDFKGTAGFLSREDCLIVFLSGEEVVVATNKLINIYIQYFEIVLLTFGGALFSLLQESFRITL